ncbi:hypothetical protein RTCIAT899_PC08215 (plasmid) [Rhizobium tropici CIAT 899]|nr:hypothetical protein RTCIAT899_PC08215 [Rhizobium tropici CIAT 899]
MIDLYQRVDQTPLETLGVWHLIGSCSLCVVKRSLVVAPLWAGMRPKSKWSPGPGIKVKSMVIGEEGCWAVSACGPS